MNRTGILLLTLCAAALLRAEVPLYLRSAGSDVPREACAKAEFRQGTEIVLLAPARGAAVPLLNASQKAFLALPRAERIALFTDAEARKKLRREAGDRPLPVRLTWKCASSCGRRHQVTVSERPDFAESVRFTVPGHELALENFKIAQKYYWRVTDGGTRSSAPSSFVTEDVPPRLMNWDKVLNVRDLGGRIGLGGRRVKQGLVYRSSGLNGNAAKPVRAEEFLSKNPGIAARRRAYLEEAQKYGKLLKSKEKTAYVKVSMTSDWLLGIPEKDPSDDEVTALARSVRALPPEIPGVKFRPVTLDAAGAFGTAPAKDRCAYLVQEFQAESTGVARFGIGADWRCFVTVNGNGVFDTLLAGNDRSPVNAGNYVVEVPVRKGKNVIFSAVRSGGAGWRLCLAEVGKDVPRARALKDMKALCENNAERLLPYGPAPVRLDGRMRDYLISSLKFASDVDLRSARECFGMTGSPAGNRVMWFHYSSRAYGGLKSEAGREAFAQVFRVFLDPRNYPVDFHCIAGQDRTGSVAFILNALLGVDEEELYRDWEVSAFRNPSVAFNHRRYFSGLLKVFDACPGKNINEKVEKFVLSLGFSPREIEWFREFMLEK